MPTLKQFWDTKQESDLGVEIPVLIKNSFIHISLPTSLRSMSSSGPARTCISPSSQLDYIYIYISRLILSFHDSHLEARVEASFNALGMLHRQLKDVCKAMWSKLA